MATTKEITICSSKQQKLVIPSVGIYGVTGSDHQLAFCDYKEDVLKIVQAYFQADSPHSGILSKLLSYVDPIGKMFGFNTNGLGCAAATLSRKIGEVTGLSGVFDQPAVSVYSETCGAIVDEPQAVRSVRFHQADWVDPVDDIISSGHDEMDLLSRMKIPVRLNAYEWYPSFASGQILTAIAVHPGFCFQENQDPVIRLYYPTPMSFFSSFYRFYRGSIKMTVEIVCTKLHQGQLFVSFDPTRTDTSIGNYTTRDKLRNCPFTVMDINTSRRYTQDIPYLSDTDYNDLNLNIINPGDTPSKAIGTFYIFVQNPLTSPTTVAGNVYVNVYISAGDDLEYIQPLTSPELQYYDGRDWVATNFQADEGNIVCEVRGNNVIPVRDTREQVQKVTNVPSVNMENVFEREYMLASGVAWKTADTLGQELVSLNMPDAFWGADFATRGLAEYHAYQRMDFEFTVKVNPSMFHAGMLLAVWYPGFKEPLDNPILSNFDAFTQFPHGFIDIAAETECVVRVPYSYYARVMPNKLAPNMGYFSVFCWNPLRTGSSQPTTLYMTVFARALNPYMGVKCPNGVLDVVNVTMQMETPSDANEATMRENELYDKMRVRREGGFVRTKHLSVKDLLRRPDYVGNIEATVPSRTNWLRVARIPALCGVHHQAIVSTYTYWTGSNKLWFVTNLTTNAAVNVMCVLGTGQYGMKGMDLTQTIVAENPAMEGVVLPRTIDKNTFVIDVPMYRTTPLVMTETYSYIGNYSTDKRVLQPVLEVYVNFKAQSATATNNFNASVYHSVGDDFQLMLWRPPRRFRQMGVVMGGIIPLANEATEGQWTFNATGGTTGNVWAPYSQTVETLTLGTSNTHFEGKYNLFFVAQSAALIVKPLVAAHNFTLRLFNSAAPTTQFEDHNIAIAANQHLGVVPAMNTAGKAYDSFKVTPVEGGYSAVIYEFQMFPYQIPATGYQMTEGVELNQTPLSKLLGTFDQDFIRQNVGGRSSTESGSLANYPRGIVEVRMQGVLDTLKQFSITVKEAFVGLQQVSKLLAGLKDLDLQVMFEWVSKLITLIFDFIEGMLLVFVCNDPVAKAIGTAKLAYFALRIVVAQQLKPPLHTNGSKFQGESSTSFKEYINSFLKSVKELLKLHTEYSFDHFLKFVEVSVDMKNVSTFTPEYLFKLITAVIQYVLDGDKALFQLASNYSAEFVERVQNGVTSENFQSIDNLRKQIDQLIIRVPRYRLPEAYRVYTRQLDQRIAEIETQKQAVGAIPEPIGMYIHADPGVGKSVVICKVLPALLQSWSCFKGSFEQFCVNTSMDEQGRIDKYDGQPIAIFDEFGSNREANEVALVIKMISQFAETIQSPFLEKKGRSFRSRMVLLLSNLKTVGVFTDKVNNIEAMARRFQRFSYSMTLKNTTKFDLYGFYEALDKCQSREEIMQILDETYNFTPLDILTGKLNGMKPVAFSSIFSELCEEWKRKESIFDKGEMIMNRIASFQMDSDEEYIECEEVKTWYERLQYAFEHDELYDFCMELSAELRLFLNSDEVLRNKNMLQQFKLDMEDYSRVLNCLRLKYPSEVSVDSCDSVTGDVYILMDMLSKVTRERKKRPFPGIVEWLRSNATLKRLGIVTLVVGSITTALWAWKCLKTTVVCQSGYEDSRWRLVPKKSTAPVRKVIEDSHHQGPDERHEKIRRNMRKISIADTGYQLCTLCVDNRTILVNQHFLRKAVGNQVYISIHDKCGVSVDRQPISYRDTDVIKVGVDTDLAVIVLRNATISGARDIRSFFQSKNQASDLINATLLAMNSEFDMEGTISRAWTTLRDMKTACVYRACPAFKFQTKNGDCGRPYVMEGHKPIIGIHCARSDANETAYFIPVFIEDIPVSAVIDYVENQYESVGEPKEWLPKHCAKGPSLWKGLPISSSSSPNSALIPLRRAGLRFAHPAWECNMAPAVLRGLGPSGAFAKNCHKYSVIPDFSVPSRCHEIIVHYWQDLVPRGVGRVLDLEEAMNGNDKLNPLQWSTSIGWLREAFGDGGKRTLFEDTEDPGRKQFAHIAKTKIIPRVGVTFVQLLEQQDHLLRSGKAIDSPWIATLKDELRSEAKVRQCKTRIFENPGLDVTIHIRRYFGDFASWYKQHFGFRLCHGIGANKETEWKTYYDELFSLIERDERIFIDLDYSNYDGSVCEDAFGFFRDLTDWFYQADSESQLARHALLYTISHANIIVHGDMIQTIQGNKSGNPLTDVFNSVTNTYIIHVSLILAQKHAGIGMDPSIIHRQMRMLTYGDDVIMGFRSEVKEWLDPDLLQALLGSFGYSVTDGAKKENIEWKTISELQFLKSKFVPYDDVVLAPMCKESIYKELFWEKKGHEKEVMIFEQKIETTQQMMAHHGEVEYGLFQQQLRERGVVKALTRMSWQERLDNIRDWQRVTAAEVLS